MRTVRSPCLVGRGSRITQGLHEALDVELRTRPARSQDPPSRGPTHNHTIQCVESHYPSPYSIPISRVAHHRGSAVRRPSKTIGLLRAIAPRKLFGLIGASPTTLLAD
jgi:hypothetical protein